MKISITTLLVGLGLVQPAVPHSLLRRRVHEVAAAPAPAFAVGAGPADAFTGDPALAIVASSGGGDYYTKAWTGENAGDSTRGTGACVAFRRTLQCNPSGVRDPKSDKGCGDVIKSDESGFCECGDYAQFAAVNCEHRPFTCGVMCVKFAVVNNRPIFYRGQQLSPAQGKQLLDTVMWGNQTDLEAMRMMTKEVQDFMGRALQYTTDSSNQAKESMGKFLDMMKQARAKDAANAAAEMANYRKSLNEQPWRQIYLNGQDMIKYGQAMQAKVKEILPFDPVAPGLNNPSPQE